MWTIRTPDSINNSSMSTTTTQTQTTCSTYTEWKRTTTRQKDTDAARNNAMQFKAEIYWLENWIDIIPSEITVIPPKGVSLQNKNAKIVFTASDSDFTNAITTCQSGLEAIKEQGICGSMKESHRGNTGRRPPHQPENAFAESNYAEITAVARGATGKSRSPRHNAVNARQRTIYADALQPFPFGKPDD